MKKHEFRILLLVLLMAGFLGGAVSSLLTVKTAFAEKKSAPHADFIKAENFELVDKQGRTRAKLTMGSDEEPVLLAYDKNGKPTAAYGLNAGGGPMQNMLDQFLGP